MKTVVLLYDTSCIYEIVILNYFLKVTGKEMQFVSLDGKEITTTEGYRIVPEDRLDSADPKDVEKNKVMAVLAYFIFFLPLLTDAKDSPFAKFHANQGLLLLLFSVIGQIVGSVVPIIG